MFTGCSGRLPLIVLLCPNSELTLVSLTTTTQSEAIVPESNHREEIADFVRWALAQLELSWDETDGRGRLPLPSRCR